jgi:adenine-specific DNA methylase
MNVEFDLRELELLTGSPEEENVDVPDPDAIKEEPADYDSADFTTASGEAAQVSERADNPEHTPEGIRREEKSAEQSNPAGEDGFRLQLSETTTQDLLRLAGETQINNGQVSAQIAALQASVQQSERYHKQIKAMAADLEALIRTRSALQRVSGSEPDLRAGHRTGCSIR